MSTTLSSHDLSGPGEAGTLGTLGPGDASGAAAAPEAAASSDRVLLRRFYEGGDQGALEALIERHQGALLRLASALLADHHAAQDAVQEAFVRLTEHSEELLRRRSSSEAGELRAWLSTVTRNWCFDRLRRRRFQQLSDQGPASDAAAGPLAQLAGSDSRQRLWQAVASLPEMERSAVLLRYRDGCSYREIASSLERSVNHVGVILNQAIGRLRSLPALREGEQP